MEKEVQVFKVAQKKLSVQWIFILLVVLILLVSFSVFYFISNRDKFISSEKKEAKEFLWDEDKKDTESRRSIYKQTTDTQETGLFDGYVLEEPILDSEGFYSFKMLAKTDSDQEIEVKVILGKKDWRFSGFEGPADKIIKQRRWSVMFVGDIVDKIKKDNQIIVWVLLLDNDLSEGEVVSDPLCKSCQEKQLFSQKMMQKNREAFLNLAEGEIPEDITVGPVNSLMF